MTRMPAGDGPLFLHVINAQLEHIGVSTPNSNTPEIREALVIGNLVFTPVHTEEKNHDSDRIS